MDIIKRLLQALGVTSTPAAVVAATFEVSCGEAAFILDAADRFEDMFARDLFQVVGMVAAVAQRAAAEEEIEKAAERFARQMELRGQLVWKPGLTVADAGEGVWMWPRPGGEGEA